MNDDETIWRSLIDRSHDGIVVVDQDGKVYDSNQRYREMLGYGAEEMGGLHVWDWDAQWTREQLLPMFRSDSDFRSAVETRHRRKDGTLLDVEISSSRAVSGGRRLTFCICRDISASKQAKKDLEASEARFRALIEKAPVAISLSRDGIGVYANQRFLEMLGMTEAGEYVGHPLIEHFAPQCRQESQERSRRRTLGLPAPAEIESVFLRQDGSQFPVQLAVGEVQLADGKVNIAFVTDITGRKQAEAEQFESEQRYRFFVETANEGVVVTQDGRLKFANAAMLELTGRSMEELTSLPFLEFIHPDDRELVRDNNLKRTRGEPVPGRYQVRLLSKFQSVKWLEISGVGIEWEGRPATMNFITDRTESTQMLAALQESEARFRSLVESSPDAIVIHQAGLISYVNSAMLKLLGAGSADELLGRELFPMIAPEDHEAVRERIRRRQETGQPTAPMENEFVRVDGLRVKVEVSAIHSHFRGAEASILFIRDISERKRMEAELIRNQKLESLGVLAGGIAHDFNNILTSLVGNLSLLRADLPQDPALEELVAEAEQAAQSGKGLAQQLLTFAKGGAPVKKALDLARLLREAAGFTLRGSGAACEFALAEGLWPVQADPGQMEQVVHNLVLNAEQAMAGRGVVSLRAANADLPQGRFVEVRVADQGTGIPQDDLAHIFEPYFTTKAKGRGLGLSIVHSIIERHGGRIAVDSRLGSGTEFRFLLPACAEAAEAPGRSPALPRAAGRVLIMDDDATVSRTLARMLKSLGCESAAVPDGESALAAYAQAESCGRGFRLVIMDLTVPGRMGGKEAVSRLKEKHPQARVAVSSGYANDPVLAGFAEFGFDAVLVKPYRLEDVAKLLA
jgi:PAS domain S-box-containing protein